MHPPRPPQQPFPSTRDPAVQRLTQAADLLAFLDRVNISNARSFGLEADLGMDPTSLQFSTAVVIFFVPYVLFEIPSNMRVGQYRHSLNFIASIYVYNRLRAVLA